LGWLEHRRPLRRHAEPRFRRLARNFTVAGLSAATVQLAEMPVVRPLAIRVEKRGLGLVPALGLPRWLDVALAVGLMDYTLYVWHVLTHRVPYLWRLHLVHHVDRDLDVSTALRFHFAELVVSVPWRAAQVAAIGVRPRALALWQTLLMLSILFHHSNVRLPLALERFLVQLIVTPRMHGIHHSAVADETNSNWSSGLTLWDRLHGTLRLDVPQDAITIGVPAYAAPDDVTLPRILLLPFVSQRPSWRAPMPVRPSRVATSLTRADHLSIAQP
jgi:sterol desaturase/sphingolipid hydroxylase (fatty acid hydroxylase superfamily)